MRSTPGRHGESPDLVLYLALPEWPGGDAGGPANFGGLVAQEIAARGSTIDVGGRAVPVRALVASQLTTVETVAERASSPPREMGLLEAPRRRILGGAEGRWAVLLRELGNRARGRRLARTIARDSKSARPIVFAYGEPAIYLLAPHKNKLNALFIHTEHSKGGIVEERAQARPGFSKSPVRKWLDKRMRRIFEASDLVLFPSRGAELLFYDRNSAFLEHRTKSGALHNGIPDPSSPRPAVANEAIPRLVLNVGAHVPEKRVDSALEGFLLFLAQLPETERNLYRFVNYGQSGATTAALRTHLSASDMAGSAQLKGTVERAELLQVAATAWACVSVPSVAVFDLAILEWMALSRAIVASPVGGNLEALGDDYACFAEGAEAVAQKLKHLHQDPDERDRIGRDNRARYESLFTMSQHLEEMSATLTELVGSHS